MSLEVGDELELVVERLAAGGDGIAHHEGQVVFVARSAPGDRVLALVVELRRRFARAEIVQVLKAGPGRREPPCPYAQSCGGCAWLHLDEATQASARRDILRDALLRIGRLPTLPEIEWLPSPRALGYRARARVARSGGAVGFRARRSHAVVDVERCAVLDPTTQEALEVLRRQPPGEGDVEIRGFERPLGLRVSPGSFFQANSALWESWAERVVEVCGRGELAVELYTGVGFYTVRLERAFARVIAVERARSASDLRHNCEVTVEQVSVEKFVLTRLPELEPDLVLLNPPRIGCDPSVIEALADRVPPRIVYVSCDPATLARDISALRDSHLVRRVVAIDALPQTNGVEALVVLDSFARAKIESKAG